MSWLKQRKSSIFNLSKSLKSSSILSSSIICLFISWFSILQLSKVKIFDFQLKDETENLIDSPLSLSLFPSIVFFIYLSAFPIEASKVINMLSKGNCSVAWTCMNARNKHSWTFPKRSNVHPFQSYLSLAVRRIFEKFFFHSSPSSFSSSLSSHCIRFTHDKRNVSTPEMPSDPINQHENPWKSFVLLFSLRYLLMLPTDIFQIRWQKP